MDKNQLKAVVMEHREPLADMYLEHCEELFSLFHEPVVASQELAPPILARTLIDSMQPLA